LHQVRIRTEPRQHHLERAQPIRVRVEDFVHRTHSATAKLAQDTVASFYELTVGKGEAPHAAVGLAQLALRASGSDKPTFRARFSRTGRHAMIELR
jgi:hypothetical protein